MTKAIAHPGGWGVDCRRDNGSGDCSTGAAGNTVENLKTGVVGEKECEVERKNREEVVVVVVAVVVRVMVVDARKLLGRKTPHFNEEKRK